MAPALLGLSERKVVELTHHSPSYSEQAQGDPIVGLTGHRRQRILPCN